MSLTVVSNPSASETQLTETDLDAAIVATWSQHLSLMRQRRETNRATAPELTRTRAQLGGLLREKHALLSGRGCEGDFRPWLREHDIPSSTAYRLIQRHLNGGKCPSGTLSSSRPAIQMRGQLVTLALTPHEAVTLHGVLSQLPHLPGPPFNLAHRLVDMLVRYPMWPKHFQLQQTWLSRPDDFTAKQAAALPHLRIPANPAREPAEDKPSEAAVAANT